jgi:U3 small nucleolar RNA-associated protein 7
MLCGGQDLRLKLWDIRALKEVHSYTTRQPASSIDISDRGLAAIGSGNSVTIWKDLFTSSRNADPTKVRSPYLNWGNDGRRVERVRFCPFDDVLSVSHSQGFSSVIVPGAGEPNYDALEVNPYETRKQRQEKEVQSLLTKLQPETIALDPNFIGSLDARSAEQRRREKDLDAPAEDSLAKLKEKEKNRARGKNSALRRYMRKKGGKNIIDEKRLRLEEMKKERSQREQEKLKREKVEFGPALARFARRGA